MKRRWTNEQLIIAVKNNRKLTDVLVELGFTTYGSNFRTIIKYIKLLKLDTSHFMTRAEHNSNARANRKIYSNEDMFCINKIDRGHIKKRILRDKLIEYKCKLCNIDEWNGEKLSLHLDHANGINNDNRLENLRFLCPNCHSLTPTYCGKWARGKPQLAFTLEEKLPLKAKYNNHCLSCNTNIGSYSSYCKKCSQKDRKDYSNHKIDWPSPKKLIKLIAGSNFEQVGKTLGVSSNAIRKRLKKNGIDPKTVHSKFKKRNS